MGLTRMRCLRVTGWRWSPQRQTGARGRLLPDLLVLLPEQPGEQTLTVGKARDQDGAGTANRNALGVQGDRHEGWTARN